MIIDNEQFLWLTSVEGLSWLQKLANEKVDGQAHLRLISRLRKKLSLEQTQAVVETVRLRQLGKSKFSRADQMYFTQAALEQATTEQVAGYRAAKFAQAGLRSIVDLGCSIGGDAIAFAEKGTVTGIEIDPIRLKMAKRNIAAYDLSAQFDGIEGDLNQYPAIKKDGFFFDPARRDELGNRIYRLQEYQPPIQILDRWLKLIDSGGVKISPGIGYDEIPEETEVEFISYKGQLREAVLWYGALKCGTERLATIVHEDGFVQMSALEPESEQVGEVGAYLYEPDPAVIRAQLVTQFAAQVSGWRIDETIAYISSDRLVLNQFGRPFLVEDVIPFQLKRVRHYLQERNIGKLTIKKRGFPMEPMELEQRLKLKRKGEARVLFATRMLGQPVIIVTQEIKRG